MLKKPNRRLHRASTVQTQNLIYTNTGGNAQPTGPSFGPCIFDERHNIFNMAGNIFLLGMVVLITEILDFTASQSLEFVLEPCIPRKNLNQEQEDNNVEVDDTAIDASNMTGF